MLTTTVYSLGDPGTFDITDKNDPQYYIARFSHEMSENYYNLQTQGFEFVQYEDSDYAAMENAFDTYVGLVSTWYDTAVQDSADGDPIASVPTFPDLTTLVPYLGQNAWVMFLVKLAIQMAIRWLRKKLDSDTDAKEITAVLRQGLLKTIDSTEYPIMELLANIPIEVIINKIGEFQDILLSNVES